MSALTSCAIIAHSSVPIQMVVTIAHVHRVSAIIKIRKHVERRMVCQFVFRIRLNVFSYFDKDLSKPDLLVVLEDRINLYNILNSSDSYTANLRNTISITNGSNIAYVQYDPLQKFVIYYDYIRHSILW